MTVLEQLSDDELAETIVRWAEQHEPELWLTRVLPGYVMADGDEDPDEAEALFSPHHREFWRWLWSIEQGVAADPFVGIWGRGEAKSTSAELGCVALGARGRRSYALYVCGTQDQADDHVGNVGSMLESAGVARWYPAMSDRLVGKFGNAKGWRRNRLRTASGFTIDALGLDTAARGVKLDDQRPDLIVIDDVDSHDDTQAIVAKKINALTKKLLPAGSPDLTVLAIQNLVHRHGVFARLSDGRAAFLATRRVSGPIPALKALVTRHEPVVDEDGNTRGRDVIVSADPTWKPPDWDEAAPDFTRWQTQIDTWGLPAFRAEAQHEVDAREGALWVADQIESLRTEPEAAVDATLTEVVVAVDPSGGSGPDNDAQGIVVCGKDVHAVAWVLDDCTVRLDPRGWGDAAVAAYVDWGADGFVAEVNYGGDMVVEIVAGALERKFDTTLKSSTVKVTPNGRTVTHTLATGQAFKVHVVSASRGKAVRAQPVAALYGRPDERETWSTARVHHAGVFTELEDEMTGWRADANWSPNRMDAAVWGLTHLMVDVAAPGRRRTSVFVP